MIQKNSNVIQIGLKKAQKRSRKCPEMAQNRLKIGSKKAQTRPRKGIKIQRNSNVIQIGPKKAQDEDIKTCTVLYPDFKIKCRLLYSILH